MKLESFNDWSEVLKAARWRQLYYQAPLDLAPRRVYVQRAFKNGKLRLSGGDCRFTADSGHLERFRHIAVDYSGEGTHTSMTYGVMPDRDAFDAAFDARCPDGTFSFGNDPYVGNAALNATELWGELEAQLATHDAGGCPNGSACNGECPPEQAGSWCSSVLGILGFEWI